MVVYTVTIIHVSNTIKIIHVFSNKQLLRAKSFQWQGNQEKWCDQEVDGVGVGG